MINYLHSTLKKQKTDTVLSFTFSMLLLCGLVGLGLWCLMPLSVIFDCGLVQYSNTIMAFTKSSYP